MIKLDPTKTLPKKIHLWKPNFKPWQQPLTSKDYEVLGRCIGELEVRTDAELVLVVTRVSGTYHDLDFVVSAFISTLALSFMIFSSVEFSAKSLPISFILVFFVSAYCLRRLPPIRRLYISKKRQNKQVQSEARSVFVEQKIHSKSDRSGILLYCSLLERKTEIIFDEKFPATRKLDIEREFINSFKIKFAYGNRALALSEFIRSLGVYLSSIMPRSSENQNHDELTNTPVIDEAQE